MTSPDSIECVGCGARVVLPDSPYVVHVACPYCRKDNVISEQVMRARWAQHARAVEVGNADDRERHLDRSRTRRYRWLVAGVVAATFAVLFGHHVYYLVNRALRSHSKAQAEESKARSFRSLRQELVRLNSQGSTHLLYSSIWQRREPLEGSLDFPRAVECARIIAVSGDPDAKLQLNWEPRGAVDLPEPASKLRVRLCGAASEPVRFSITGDGSPFAVGAVGRARSGGKAR